jgi:membrane associated rhomboid family serine protease
MEIRLRRPTLEALAVVLVLFVVQQALRLVAPAAAALLFTLSAPLAQPWAVVTSVYAHGSVGHLASNAVGLLLFGLAVERVTTRWRFHAFFLVVGALSAVAEVAVQSLLAPGPVVGVLGASGAVLGLLGYLLAGNALSAAVVGRLSLDGRQQAVLFGAVAVLLTIATAGPRVAVVGHFTGLALGLAAGRLRLLHVSAPVRNGRH